MPVSDAQFTDAKSPLSTLTKIMRMIERGSIEAHFTNEKNEPTLSREYVEMAFQDFAIQQQNSQVMNKWIALDTKLDKAMLEYVSEVKLLIASVIQTGTAQTTMTGSSSLPSAPGEGMGASPLGAAKPSAMDRELPVTREE
jgi:hypothetical protein